MTILDFIAPLEGNLSAHVSLLPAEGHDCWLMRVRLFCQGEAAGVTSFTLQGYSIDEAEWVARTLKYNAFLMKEIDEFLWGESD